MRFIELTLTDFRPLSDSGIKSLTLKFQENVHITIGANGSGKSVTQRQLSPFPPPKTIFGKNGYKALKIEHEGLIYTLESEYDRSTSPHLFYEDESKENLNQGRTTETQRELIETHLGITPFVDDLIMNRFLFPKWKATARKEFLMAHNPDKIGFVYGLAKQTASKIKACKNNLNHLNSRKILLEQDLISDEIMADLQAEKQGISQELGEFQQTIMDIEVALRTLPQNRGTIGFYDITAITRTLRSVRYKMADLAHIERDDGLRTQRREMLIGQLASHDHQIAAADEDLLTKANELAELEVRYRELAPDADLREVEYTIERLERDRDRLRTPAPAFELSREELDRRYQEWEIFTDQLLLFQDRSIPLYSRRKRDHRERMRDRASYRKSSYEMKLTDLRTQLEDLAHRHTIAPSDIPSPCARDACPLFAHFMDGYQNTQEKRNNLQIQIARIHHRLYRLNQYLTGVITYFETSAIYADRIQWLVTQAQSNPILHGILRQVDLLTTLSNNPNRLSRMLKEAYDQIDQWLKLKLVLADLETAYALKRRFIGSQDHDAIKLVVSIENLKKALTQRRDDVQTLSDARRLVRRQLDEIATYESLKQTVLTIRNAHIGYVEALAHQHESDSLHFLKRSVEDIRARHFLRMGEVEGILRTQSGLRERYHEEVIKEISRIEKLLADYEQIEKALLIIPKENTIAFVNGIFTQANLLIDSIWTIPLKIELLNYDDPLDYRFQVSGDNQSTRELDECSDGQTEILSLAINLALRIQLGHLNLPLCLDEAGRTFDDKHKQNLVFLLRRLLDDKVISQLFLINHHASIHEGFSQSETFVIREDNITCPEVFNQHVTMRY